SLLVCVNRSASLHAPLASAETFCVNVLGLGNRDVAEHFMQGPGEERFAVGEWEEEEWGVPVLASAQSSFICRRRHCHDFGTHSIFIGELVAAKHRTDAAPLTYYDRHYIDISGAPESSIWPRFNRIAVRVVRAGGPASSVPRLRPDSPRSPVRRAARAPPPKGTCCCGRGLR